MAYQTLSKVAKFFASFYRVFTNSIVVLSLLLLSSCGQSGPLYLPDQQQTTVGQENATST